VPAALPAPLDEARRPTVADGSRVLYEAHVRGLTRHPSSRVSAPGTYAGVIEKLPYLAGLGVTTLELLPVAEFDETENRRVDPFTGERLVNYWGYSPVSFFAPKAAYARRPGAGRELLELRELVDAAHARGLEVVLDVVFNHTAEAGLGADDPLRSFARLAPEVYYLLDAHGRPLDFTGCGHTVRLDHPVVRRLVLDALRFQVERLGVDGFRFDLAAAMFRGGHGEPLERSPLAEEIAADPVLGHRLLIAEPWDLGGFDVTERLPPPWRAWNGRFRDAVRRVARGDAGLERALALRLAGSPDRFRAPRGPSCSIDFVTCHDGFTLADLVSYTAKRNLANGEDNRDGADENHASNAGVEGPSDAAAVRSERLARRRLLLALTLLTRGTPMLLAGDECGRTQAGNNNAWCRDDEVGWVVWPDAGEGELVELVRRLTALRREGTSAAAPRGAAAPRAAATIPLDPEADGSAVAVSLEAVAGAAGRRRLILVNGGRHEARFPAPRARPGHEWALRLDLAGQPESFSRAAAPRLAPETEAITVAPGSLRVLDELATGGPGGRDDLPLG
jgi:glycogen operon protein